MSVNVEIISSYKHYGRCLSLSNKRLTLYITLDVGPRIIFLSLDKKTNLLWNDDEQKMVVEGPEMESYFGPGARFCFYGGHRIWLAPQHEIRTCIPDNHEISYVPCKNGIILSPPVQDPPGVQPKITILMDPSDASFSVTAEYTNTTYHPLSFALWQITQMAPGGLAIVPFHRGIFDPTKVLVPRRQLSVFDITDLRDHRFYLGDSYITLRQIPGDHKPFKIGTRNADGWCLYAGNGAVVVKQFGFQERGSYTDGGVNCEIYTGDAFLELESLGTYLTLDSMNQASYTERFTVSLLTGELPKSDCEPEIREFVRNYGLE